MPHFSHSLHIASLRLLVATALVALFVLSLPAAAHAVTVSKVERQEVELINRYRVAKGLPRLTIDVKLTRAAKWMSADMAGKNRFSHTDSRGRDPFARMAAFGYPSRSWRGENLAAGYDDPRRTFAQWRNSPGHDRNMRNGRFTAIGISRVYDSSSPYRYYWTTKFGSKVTRGVANPAVVRRTTPAQRRKIRSRMKQCQATARSSASWKRMRCGWNMRMARQLGFR